MWLTLFNKLVSWRQISWRHGALIYLFGATGLIKSDRPDERLSRGRSAGQPIILPDPLNCVNIHSVCLCVLLYCALMLVFPVQGFFLSAPLNACLCVCVRERGIVHVQKNAEGGWLAAGHAGGRRVSKFYVLSIQTDKVWMGHRCKPPRCPVSPHFLHVWLFHLLTSLFFLLHLIFFAPRFPPRNISA